MAKMKGGGDLTVVVGGKGKSGFYELAKAHVANHGGEWFVVDRTNAEQRQQWRAWIGYAAWLDDQTWPRGHKAATWRSLEKLTVPTVWPLEFDASAPPAPLPEPREELPTPERRRALAAMLRQAVAHMGMPEEPRRIGFERARSPAEAEAARQHFEARLPELQAEYCATAPKLGPALRQAAKSVEPALGLQARNDDV
jgi:hypothetical protein